MTPGLFDWADEYTEPRTYGQRLTARWKALLARGVHPVSRKRLREEPGETCGSCIHHVQQGRYHKCDLNFSFSEATDIRVSWPACELWRPEEAS